MGWRGVTTKSYLDISTAFRSESAERRARPKAELQRMPQRSQRAKGAEI